MSTCETCKWWTAHTDLLDGPSLDYGTRPLPGTWGTCDFLVDTSHVYDETEHSERAYPQDASSYKAWLIVRSDFGCIEHAPPAPPQQSNP